MAPDSWWEIWSWKKKLNRSNASTLSPGENDLYNHFCYTDAVEVPACVWSKFSCAILPSEWSFAHMSRIHWISFIVVLRQPSELSSCRSNTNPVEAGALPAQQITDDPAVGSDHWYFGRYECVSSVLTVSVCLNQSACWMVKQHLKPPPSTPFWCQKWGDHIKQFL